MSAAIAVFAKTPELSPIKTRLAAGIGNDLAAEFYQLCLEIAEELLSKAPLTPYWAIAEEEGLSDGRWQNMDRIWTGEGGLGDRLHHVYATLRKDYDTVLLIGTDSPQLAAQHIEQAISHLSKHKGFVIGQALDGGFYLFGSNVAIPRSVWTKTPYSVSNTSQMLAEKLTGLGNIHYLETLTDVDIASDLAVLLRHRDNMTLASQQKLISWIDKRIKTNI